VNPTLEHPTFNGQWVLLGDKVAVGQPRGVDRSAVVIGLRQADDVIQVMVRYDRKPPAHSQCDWVMLNRGSGIGSWPWIESHHPSEA
jgi:hypothetical protein